MARLVTAGLAPAPIMMPESIISQAVAEHDPSHVVLAVSGGYDSLCMAHYVHAKDIITDRPLLVRAIDTKLSADGWREWLTSVAASYGWNFAIYDNAHGFKQYIEWVRQYGQPRGPAGHKRAYARLKDRAFDGLLRELKTEWRGRSKHSDRILFLTGIRKYESTARSRLESPFSPRRGAACWANPLFYWTDRDILTYRIDNELPINPFYETVGGSGDCQCNWGRFITLRKLALHSPKLAAGNVALIDRLSRDRHGYGWDGGADGQMELFDDEELFASPFLCAGCSRSRATTPGRQQAEEDYIMSQL